MPTDKKQINVHLTNSQIVALRQATKRSGLKASEARREALRLFCEAQGVQFPDNMPQHGGKREQSE